MADTENGPAPAREQRFQRRMSDAEALMWNVEKDPWLNPSGGSFSILDRMPDVEHLRAQLAVAIITVPRLMEHVIGGLGRYSPPTWRPDPEFDLDQHLRISALPAPGSMEQLLDTVTRDLPGPLRPDPAAVDDARHRRTRGRPCCVVVEDPPLGGRRHWRGAAVGAVHPADARRPPSRSPSTSAPPSRPPSRPTRRIRSRRWWNRPSGPPPTSFGARPASPDEWSARSRCGAPTPGVPSTPSAARRGSSGSSATRSPAGRVGWRAAGGRWRARAARWFTAVAQPVAAPPPRGLVVPTRRPHWPPRRASAGRSTIGS